MSKGTIKKIAGPLVIATGMRDANMFDVVRVGERRLIGEIIEIHDDQASIQVYEETSGLAPGAPVESTGVPMSVELGPGLISSIYDGIQRPLDGIMRVTGSNQLQRGVEVPSRPRDKVWHFVPSVEAGAKVTGGGVAQVASALWLAIKDLDNIKITEKSTYGSRYNQRYVADPADAVLTDYASGRDFCFRYTGKTRLTIYAYVEGGRLYCDVIED